MSSTSQNSSLSPILDKLIVSCSHELKSPITSLQGLIQVAEYYSDNVEVKRCLQMMKMATDTMQHNLNSMAQYFECMQRQMTVTSIDAHEVVDETLGRYAAEIKARNIRLTKDVNQLFTWHADRIYCQVILDNLVSNAIHFQDEEKHSKEMHVSVVVNQELAAIIVSDNGIGIERHRQEKVFDMFSRNSTLSRGCGMGLFLTNALVKKMRGTCTLSSRAGIGSRMKVTIPNAVKVSLFLFLLLFSRSFLHGQSLSFSVDAEKAVNGMHYGSAATFHTKNRFALGTFYQMELPTVPTEFLHGKPFYGVLVGAPVVKSERMTFSFVLRTGLVDQRFLVAIPGLETRLRTNRAIGFSLITSLRNGYPSVMGSCSLKIL